MQKNLILNGLKKDDKILVKKNTFGLWNLKNIYTFAPRSMKNRPGSSVGRA